MSHSCFSLVILLFLFCVNRNTAFTLSKQVNRRRSSWVLSERISDKVVVEFQPSNKIIQVREGDQLSDVAVKAGVEISYKCRKGECGTCQVKIDNKWVKACQTVIAAPSVGDVLFVNVKPVSEVVKSKKPSTFFSPASFVEGVINNGVGVIGFVAEALKVDDEFQARMEREKKLNAKIAEKKRNDKSNNLSSSPN